MQLHIQHKRVIPIKCGQQDSKKGRVLTQKIIIAKNTLIVRIKNALFHGKIERNGIEISVEVIFNCSNKMAKIEMRVAIAGPIIPSI